MSTLTLTYGDRVQRYLLRQCRVCVAPLVRPVPPEMTFDLVREGPASGPVHSFVTPHRPGCRAPTPGPVPGVAVRVPGSFLTLNADDLVPLPHAFQPLAFGTPSGPGSSDWCGFGALTHMVAGRGFCGRVEVDRLHLPVRLARRGEMSPHFQVRRPDGTTSVEVVLSTRLEPVGLPADGTPVDLDVFVYVGDRAHVISQVRLADGDSVTVAPPAAQT